MARQTAAAIIKIIARAAHTQRDNYMIGGSASVALNHFRRWRMKTPNAASAPWESIRAEGERSACSVSQLTEQPPAIEHQGIETTATAVQSNSSRS
jgi:hypothetical protein